MNMKERRKGVNQNGVKVRAVDLFCGAGGLTRGLLDAGIEVVSGYDIDGACRYAYEHNNDRARFVEKGVEDVPGWQLARDYGDRAGYRVLVGCAPCQPFSKYTQGQDTHAARKWGLLKAFGRLVTEVRPDVVSMENVPELRRHAIFAEFVETLEGAGYAVNYQEAYCPDFGVPQQRRRLVLMASSHGSITLRRTAPMQDPESVTVRAAIGNLPEIAAGEQGGDDRYHRASRLSATNLRRIRASAPGGTWRDWPEELVAACHRTEMGINYPSVYGRMQWDAPAPTITTQFFGFGNGRFGHPEQDRAISLREGALLQTFPHDYEFLPAGQPVVISHVGKMIGNAVPVRLGHAIGISIREHLEQLSHKN